MVCIIRYSRLLFVFAASNNQPADEPSTDVQDSETTGEQTMFQKAEAELGDMAKSEEDVLSYIAFPPVAEAFFKARQEREEQKVAYSITKVEE